MSPLVSVVTAAFNAEQDIHRALESVAGQSCPVLEHIVIDDGSEDDTSGMVERFGDGHRVRLVRQTRAGAAAARNRGIALARGRYIAFLDSDDEWLPDKLASQIGFMEQSGTVFSYGDYLRCHHQSRVTLGAVLTPAQLSHADFLRGCPIGCLTVAYNQEALGKVFMPTVWRGHDWGLWLALTRTGVTGHRYPGVQAIYSVQRGSLSARKMRKARDIFRIYRREEGLGRLHSAWLLVMHSINSFRSYKRPV